jgi:hypothetical protein
VSLREENKVTSLRERHSRERGNPEDVWLLSTFEVSRRPLDSCIRGNDEDVLLHPQLAKSTFCLNRVIIIIMRTDNDPDLRKYNPDDDMEQCSKCAAFMVPLKEYEISNADEAPTVGAEWWEFLLWGWIIFVANYLYDLMTFNGRKSKLAELKKTVLPQFPRSLICPSCLHVKKKQ